MRKSLGLPPFAPTDISWNSTESVNDAMKWDASNYMPDNILVKTDRASMAVGLELRSPFLDTDVAEFLFSLPASLKINQHSDKLLLRETFADDLPAYLKTQTKRGFGISNDNWIRDPAIKQDVHELVLDAKSPLYGLLPYDVSSPLRESPRSQLMLLQLAYWAEQRQAGRQLSQVDS